MLLVAGVLPRGEEVSKRKQQAAILAGIFSLFTVLWVLMEVWPAAIVFAVAALIAFYDFWKGGILP